MKYKPKIEPNLLSLSKIKCKQRIVRKQGDEISNDSSNSNSSMENIKLSSLIKELFIL